MTTEAEALERLRARFNELESVVRARFDPQRPVPSRVNPVQTEPGITSTFDNDRSAIARPAPELSLYARLTRFFGGQR